MRRIFQEISGKTSGTPFLEQSPFIILLFAVFLLPFFFVPTPLVIFPVGKITLLALAVIASLVLWIFSSLKNGEFSIPNSWLIGSIFIVVAAYFLSALFSDSIRMSLVGLGFETGTFSMILTFAILLLLVPLVFRSRQKLFYVYLAFFGSFAVVAIYQLLRIIFGPDFLSFGVFVTSTESLVGRWNDLGLFFALSAILSMATLELLRVSRNFKILLYTVLVVSLFFLAVINFLTIWIALGVFAFIFFVYLLSFSFSASSTGGDSLEREMLRDPFHAELSVQPNRRRISGISIAVIAVSLIFVVSGNSLGSFLSNTLNISRVDAWPSWNATFNVAGEVLKEDVLFGAGPNRFSNAWLKNKPEGVNNSLFWDVDFNFGVGFIPTAAATTGLVGIIAWLVFLALFVYTGFKVMFSRIEDRFSYYLVVSSFLASLFLWTFAVVYVPNTVMLSLTFLFTGVFVGALYQEKIIGKRKISFSNRPAINFASVLVSVLIVVSAVVAGYFVSQHAVSSVLFQRSIRAFNVDGDIDRSQTEIVRAINLHKNDSYYRTLAGIQMAKLSATLSQRDISEDLLRSQSQRILSSAIQSVRIATEIDPSNYQNWTALGRIYQAIVPLQVEGAYESAMEAYKKALELNPHGPSLYLTLARLEAANNNLKGAREFITNALVEKSNYTEAIFLLSQIEMSEGNVQGAIRSVEAAAILSPNDPVVFFQLGLLKYNNRDYLGAISALESATALSPDYANARYFLGLSYEKTGRDEDAIEEFEAIEQLNPGNQEVKFILSNLRAGRAPFAGVEPPLDDEPEAREELPIEE